MGPPRLLSSPTAKWSKGLLKICIRISKSFKRLRIQGGFKARHIMESLPVLPGYRFPGTDGIGSRNLHSAGSG